MTIINAKTPNVSFAENIAAFLPFILIGLIFYFLILRPQSKQRKKQELMLDDLKIGDKILTRGGIYGTINKFLGKNKKKISIDVGSGVKLIINRSYVSDLQEK